jgi:K+-transporting ATPase ATPase A chain
MTLDGILQCLVFFAVLLALVRPLGAFIARVYEGEETFLHPVLGPVERALYRMTGVDPTEGMSWRATRSRW